MTIQNPYERILKFVNEYAEFHGKQLPTFREIERGSGITLATVHHYVDEMVTLGYMRHRDRKYWITDEGYKLIKRGGNYE